MRKLMPFFCIFLISSTLVAAKTGEKSRSGTQHRRRPALVLSPRVLAAIHSGGRSAQGLLRMFLDRNPIGTPTTPETPAGLRAEIRSPADLIAATQEAADGRDSPAGEIEATSAFAIRLALLSQENHFSDDEADDSDSVYDDGSSEAEEAAAEASASDHDEEEERSGGSAGGAPPTDETGDATAEAADEEDGSPRTGAESPLDWVLVGDAGESGDESDDEADGEWEVDIGDPAAFAAALAAVATTVAGATSGNLHK